MEAARRLRNTMCAMNAAGILAPPFRWTFLSPRYWLIWLGVALLWLVTLLPVPVLIPLGEAIGWLFGRLAPGRRHVVRVNLRACFP